MKSTQGLESSARPSKPNYKAHIDQFSAGCLTGWVYDQALIYKDPKIQIYISNNLIGIGIANLYRTDLKEAGYTDGKHGFSIPLNLIGLQQGEHNVILVVENMPVFTNDFILAIPEQKWIFTKIQRDGLIINVWVKTALIDEDDYQIFELFIDEEFISETQISPDYERNQLVDDMRFFKLTGIIPPKYFDGMPHVIKISSPPGSEAILLEDNLFPSLTPYEYLKSQNNKSKYFTSFPDLSLVRNLAAFQLRLSNEAFQDKASIISALTAFNFLTEENTRSQTKLNFPKFDDITVSIIVPVHNQYDFTKRCLMSIFLNSISVSYEVILIDDCSTDNTKNILDDFGNLIVISNKKNIGFLRSCNLAAKKAKGNYIFLLNNDTELTLGSVEELIDTFNRFENVGIVGAKLLFPNNTLQEAGGIIWDNGSPWNLGRGDNPYTPEWNYLREVDYVSGAALLIKKTLWDDVGGFSEEFAPAYYEDTDLCFKVKSKGLKIIFNPIAEVIHFEGGSNGTDIETGIKAFQKVNEPKFRSKWADACKNNGEQGVEVWKHKDRGIRYRALVIDYATPQSDKDAGSYAAVQEMRLLQALGFKVTFFPANLANLGQYTIELQKRGIEVIYAPFYSSFNQFIQSRGHEFDLAYITRYHVAEQYVEIIRQYPRIKILFLDADLHFLREIRELSFKNQDISPALNTREKELNIISNSDAVLSYSEIENAVILSHNLSDKNLFKCPWVVKVQNNILPFSKRDDIVFLGSYNHLPNRDAFNYILNTIAPRIIKKGINSKIRIYGSNWPSSNDVTAPENVEIMGYAKSLADVFSTAKIFISPLEYGAGLKGKVIDAISFGVPTILSPISAEATGLTHGVSTIIATSPEEWEEAIIKLYTDVQLWEAISKNSIQTAKMNFSFEVGVKQMRKPINYLQFFSSISASYLVPKD